MTVTARSALALALWAVAVAGLLLGGCSSKQEEGPDEFEKWTVLAEESPGHSPKPRTLEEAMADIAVEEPQILEEPEAAPERPLPQVTVSLRMRDADILAVLQALSRAANQSIVVSPAVAGTVNINIVSVPWDQVFQGILSANGLVYDWAGEIIRVMTLGDLKMELEKETIQKQRQAERQAVERLEPLQTSIVKVKFADAEGLRTNLEKFLTKSEEGEPRGSIEVDQHTNSLIIQSSQTDMRKLVKVVARLDRPRSQINLKAHIVETNKDTARALGVQWGGQYQGDVRSGNSLFLVPGGSGTFDPDTGQLTYVPELNQGLPGISGQGYGMSFLPDDFPTDNGSGTALGLMFGKLDGNILEAQLKALEDEKKINIISSPSITTLDNQKAYTESGERVPFQTDGTGDTGTTIEWEDAVLRLEITPHIIDDELLKLTLLIKKDEVDTTRTVSGNPFIIKKKTETTLVARNGETIVIAGLSKSRTNNGEQGVPGLKDVDGLGWLFKSQNKGETMDEFLIFITPTILAQWQDGQRQRTLDEIEEQLQNKYERDALLDGAEEVEMTP